MIVGRDCGVGKVGEIMGWEWGIMGLWAGLWVALRVHGVGLEDYGIMGWEWGIVVGIMGLCGGLWGGGAVMGAGAAMLEDRLMGAL